MQRTADRLIAWPPLIERGFTTCENRPGPQVFSVPFSLSPDTGVPGKPPGGRNGPALLSRYGVLLAGLVVYSATHAGYDHAAPVGGFYLRAGIGLDHPPDIRFTDVDCSSASPAALDGCGTGGDGAPCRSMGDFETSSAV
ncbi:MAG: hypothetical protein OXL41_09430 [Nitrospinae bacterium]|nr:hypothetical protein [Nitrospinota bacterium]